MAAKKSYFFKLNFVFKQYFFSCVMKYINDIHWLPKETHHFYFWLISITSISRFNIEIPMFWKHSSQNTGHSWLITSISIWWRWRQLAVSPSWWALFIRQGNGGDFRAWSYSLYKAMQKDIEISVQKFEMQCLGNDERHRAMGMLDGGMSCRHVARHFGCSPSTINRLLQRHRETGSVNDRPRSGRERVTTPDQDRYIVLQHLRDRFLTASETAAATPGRHQPRISGNTVRWRLYESDLWAHRPAMVTLLTPEGRQNRLIWSRRHVRWTQRNWNQVIFSDESRFCLSKPDGRERVWRRRGERYAECCVCQYNCWGGASVMLWWS